MSRYDGLIIPRSYSEYINKTDAATLQQALQLSGVLSGAVAAGDNKAVKSSAVNNALSNQLNLYEKTITSEENGRASFRYIKQGKLICGSIYYTPSTTNPIVFSSVKIPNPRIQSVFRVRNNNTGNIYDLYVSNNGSVTCAFSPTVDNTYSGILCYVID